MSFSKASLSNQVAIANSCRLRLGAACGARCGDDERFLRSCLGGVRRKIRRVNDDIYDSLCTNRVYSTLQKRKRWYSTIDSLALSSRSTTRKEIMTGKSATSFTRSLSTSTKASTSTDTSTISQVHAQSKVALIMGVANQKSIAWNCVETFLSTSSSSPSRQQHIQEGSDWNVIMTYHPDNGQRIASLLNKYKREEKQQEQDWTMMYPPPSSSKSTVSSQPTPPSPRPPRVVAVPCNVQTDIQELCYEIIPDIFGTHYNNNTTITSIVHSIAYGNLKGKSMLRTTRDDFLLAHEISSYSLLEIAQAAIQSGIFVAPPTTPNKENENHGDEITNKIIDDYNGAVGKSITTISYLGAHRAIDGYHTMGPAKASLEAVVRGLALELGSHNVHVNAVSAGPITTLSSKGGINNFSCLKERVKQRAPLGLIHPKQVASMVHFLANQRRIGEIGGGDGGGGITGQTIYVDGGYSSVD